MVFIVSKEPIGFYNENGKKIGNWTYLHDNGNLESIGFYNENGKKDGNWTYNHSDGKLNKWFI